MGHDHDTLKADFQAKMDAVREALATSDDPSARMLAELAPMVEAYQEWCNDVPLGTPLGDMVDAQTNFVSNIIGFTICFHALNARVPASRVAVEIGHKVNRAVHDYVETWAAGDLESHLSRRGGRGFDFRDLMEKGKS